MRKLEEKIESALKEKFVGNYIFTEEELAEIYSKTGKLLRDVEYDHGVTISPLYDDLFFVAIINATKDHGCMEYTWQELVFKRLMGCSGSQKLYLHLTSVIQRIGEKGKAFFLSSCQKKYYATALGHAFAPTYSIHAFFELCWEIFCEDFDCTYENNDAGFLLLVEALRSKFLNCIDEEEFTVGSKAYSLRIGIKQLAIDNPSDMLTLIDTTMCLIDKSYNKGELLHNSSYYEILFGKWWLNKEKSFGEIKPRQAGMHPISDYEKITIKYRLKNNDPCIEIPSIRLKDHYYNNPIITIYSDEEKVFERELITAGTGLMMSTKKFEILFSDINGIKINNIRIKILHVGKIIYDSRKTLHRELILFRSEREIISNECSPGNYIFYIDDFDKLGKYPKSISRIKPDIYSIFSLNREILCVGKKIVCFNEEHDSSNMWIAGNSKENLKFLYEGVEYKVFNGDLTIAIADSVNCKHLDVKIDGISFKLIDFTKERENSINYYNITEIIDVCKPTNIVIYNILDNSIIFSEHIVKFNNINTQFDKKYYYDNSDMGVIHFSTEKYKKSKKFNLENDFVDIDFEEGVLLIDIPIVKWKINDETYNKKSLDNILWYKKYNNGATLEIICPPNLSCDVFANDNTFLQTVRGKANIYALGDKIYSSLDSCENMIIAAKINDEIVKLFEIALKEQFYSEPSFNIENGIFNWNLKNCYIGDSDVFDCVVVDNENVVFAKQLGLKPEKSLVGTIEEGYYKLKIYTESKGFIKNKLLIYEKDICIGNEKNLKYKNKYFQIKEVMLSNVNELTPIKPIYIDNIKFVEDKDGSSFYTGHIYIVDSFGKKRYLNYLKNDNEEDERMNPVRIEIGNCRICWLVSKVNENNINDFWNEFTLDGWHQLSNKDNGAKAIDYYKYEVKKNV